MPTLFDEPSVFAGGRDLPSLLNRLDKVALEGKQQVQVCVIASKRPILQVLREIEVRAPDRIILKETTDETPRNASGKAATFSLKRRYGVNERKSVGGDFLVLPDV